jgi:PAS domain S-box-containing protein
MDGIPQLPVSSRRSSAVDPRWQRQLELLLESTGEGVFGLDLEGNCTFINTAGARMLGWQPEEVLGRNMHVLTHHSHADGCAYPAADCPIFNAFRRGLPCRIDAEVFWRRDGRAFPVEYSSHPLLDDGQVRGAVVTFVDITERRRAEEVLKRANDELEARVAERTEKLSVALGQLRELAAYSEKVREHERTRIAREVHDELGSLLVALKLDVNWIAKRLAGQAGREPADAQAVREQLRSKCGNMSALIDSAVDRVGRIITDLRPSILDHQGLWAALEWQAFDFAQSAELQLGWHMAHTEGVVLPDSMGTAVFRIFQEMLSNVGRHARASALEVTIRADTQELLVEVRDNGCGAPAQAFDAPTAYGVLGMRERARHFGGRLEISSVPGRGTCLRLLMPIWGAP